MSQKKLNPVLKQAYKLPITALNKIIKQRKSSAWPQLCVKYRFRVDDQFTNSRINYCLFRYRMLPGFLLLAFCTLYQVDAKPEPVAWPLFEFWNPLTWINPKFSTETMLHILKPGRESTRKVYQQLKKALLPANLFFGNIRAQFAAWDIEKQKKKPENSKESRRPTNKKFNKNSASKNQ